VEIICVSSQSMIAVQRIDHDFRSHYSMLSDPELLLGAALNVPTIMDVDKRWSHRIALVMYRPHRKGVFYLLSDADAAANAPQVWRGCKWQDVVESWVSMVGRLIRWAA
jgi:hypothetical protein